MKKIKVTVTGKTIEASNEKAIEIRNSKLLQFERLGIKTTSPAEDIADLITQRAKDKALSEGAEDYKPYLKGQEFYINGLIQFAKTVKEKGKEEGIKIVFNQAFNSIASIEEKDQFGQDILDRIE